MAYVYEHWRPDLDKPFWVGKGTRERSRIFRRRRNPHYAAVIAKLDLLGVGPEVRIIADNLTDEAAFALEIERIAYWRAKGIKLCNYAVGGRGGMSGVKRSAESRAKQSASSTGRKLSADHVEKIRRRVRSEKFREQNRKTHLGRKRPFETGQKISETNRNIYADPARGEQRREAIRRANTGKIVSEETRSKMRAAKTPEVRARLSAATKRQWENSEFRALVSNTMKATNALRKEVRCAE